MMYYLSGKITEFTHKNIISIYTFFSLIILLFQLFYIKTVICIYIIKNN